MSKITVCLEFTDAVYEISPDAALLIPAVGDERLYRDALRRLGEFAGHPDDFGQVDIVVYPDEEVLPARAGLASDMVAEGQL